MALTKIGTDGIKDDAVTSDKVANAINSSIAANTAKDLTALSASNLTSGTIPDARFPATLPAASAANLTAVPAANITGTLPAISGANLTNLPASGKAHNLVINGAMNVAQRGTSSTSSGFKTVDRWHFGGSWPGSSMTQEQADVGYTTAPYDKGFRKSYKLTNSNQGSASAGSNIEITYSFEGRDIAASGWDYVNSSAKITLSFWIKSSVAQTFYGYFRTFEGTSAKYSFPIVCSTTGWEYKTVSIVGEGNFAQNVYNTFRMDNSRDLILRIVPFYGTDYTDSGAINNAWQNYSSSNITPVYDTSWFLTNGATFELTGVQLEVGDTANDFSHEDYATTLTKCKRYYQRSTDSSRGTDYSLSTGTWHSADGVHSFSKHNNYYDWSEKFEVEMRAAPTLTIYGSSNQGDIHIEQIGVGSSQVDWNNNTTEVKTKGFMLRHIEDSYGTSGSGNGFGIMAYTVDAEL